MARESLLCFLIHEDSDGKLQKCKTTIDKKSKKWWWTNQQVSIKKHNAAKGGIMQKFITLIKILKILMEMGFIKSLLNKLLIRTKQITIFYI